MKANARKVLEALREDAWLRTGRLSRRAGLSKSTVRHHLRSLVSEGLAERSLGYYMSVLGTVIPQDVYRRTKSGSLALGEKPSDEAPPPPPGTVPIGWISIGSRAREAPGDE